MLSTTVVRNLRVPGYLILAMTALEPITEVLLRSAPFRVHSPAWRLALITGGAGAAVTALLALFLMLAIATVAEDRGIAYLVSSVSGLSAGLCVLAAGTFALDALQTKNDVQAPLSDLYNVGSVWIVVRVVVAAILFITLALYAMRIAKLVRFVSERPAGRRASILINTPPRPTTPAASSPPLSRERVD
jgi:hypothetical protein